MNAWRYIVGMAVGIAVCAAVEIITITI